MLKKLLKTKKSCSKYKNRSRQKVAEQLVESPTGTHPDGHQHGDRKPTETLATEVCYQGINLSLEELKN